MSVTNVVSIADNGLYVPFRGVARDNGPVGTLLVQAQVTGDGSGGSASLSLTCPYVLFGFHPLLACTRIHTIDLLTTLQNLRMIFNEAGNERIDHDIQEVVVPVELPPNNQHGNATVLGVPIEPTRVEGNVLSAAWVTNVDTIDYDIHAFFMVYDLEFLARHPGTGSIDALVSGIR